MALLHHVDHVLQKRVVAPSDASCSSPDRPLPLQVRGQVMGGQEGGGQRDPLLQRRQGEAALSVLAARCHLPVRTVVRAW